MLYKIFNGPMPTAASQVPVTTTALLRTLLQIKPGATSPFRAVEWGISFDASAAGVPGIVELCATDVAATVTAHVASGIHKYDASALLAGDPTTSTLIVGTAATGYTATAEGTIAALRQADARHIAPTDGIWFQFPLGREFTVLPSEVLRLRSKFAVAVNAICYVLIEA